LSREQFGMYLGVCQGIVPGTEPVPGTGFVPGTVKRAPPHADTSRMGFIGGQRPFSVGAALLTALIGVGVVATATEPIGVSLPELAEEHALEPTRDRITGVVTLRGEAGVVRLCPGLATIAVNGRAVALDRPVSVHCEPPGPIARRAHTGAGPRAGCRTGRRCDLDRAPARRDRDGAHRQAGLSLAGRDRRRPRRPVRRHRRPDRAQGKGAHAPPRPPARRAARGDGRRGDPNPSRRRLALPHLVRRPGSADRRRRARGARPLPVASLQLRAVGERAGLRTARAAELRRRTGGRDGGRRADAGARRRAPRGRGDSRPAARAARHARPRPQDRPQAPRLQDRVAGRPDRVRLHLAAVPPRTR
jgi:hypothetical protein